MKTIENKLTGIKKSEPDVKCTYGDLITISLNTIQKERWMPSEIRSINKIVDVVELSNGKIVFEDADAKYLLQLINQFGIPVKGKEAESFLNDLEQMMKESK